MSLIKSQEEIEILREAGRRLAEILDKVKQAVVPGVAAGKLNRMAERLIFKAGDIPAFLNYKPNGAKRPYPASLCVSINNEVVHGIPNEQTKLIADGDIVGLDIGLKHRGMIVDMAVTVGVGVIDDTAQKLIEVAHRALMEGIRRARHGARVGDISAAIEQSVRPTGFSIVENLGGHGVGHAVHEDPYIPNFGKPGVGMKLEAGMVLALEPMINEGAKEVVLEKDGYTFSTKDGSRSAHFEHTILITPGEAEILTQA
jgi:methionyl aminopeptidase